MLHKGPALPLGRLINNAAKVLAGMRILLVEDSKVSRYILEKFLGSVGIKSLCAETGYNALQILEKEDFDLVLMDLQMPGIDGYETIRQIRQTLKLTDLPIIVITGNSLEEEGRACLEVGASGFLGKPILPEDLFPLLQQFAKTPRAGSAVKQEE